MQFDTVYDFITVFPVSQARGHKLAKRALRRYNDDMMAKRLMTLRMRKRVSISYIAGRSESCQKM